MPIQIQDINKQDDIVDCPLCMETLEVDDINFFPCECGYQICRFCWHRIRTDENGLCPACRKSYPENPAEFKPLSEQELQKIRLEKKQKEVARRQKITDSRKHLANVRVLQKNLVFVVGLSQRLADIEILKKQEYFGKYGKILKVVLNSNTSYAGTQAPSCSAYVTYSKVEESLRAIQSVNNVHIDGRTLKASLGTTKYCSNYLKNQVCQKHDCMYLHEIGDEDASFTKEDMQLAKHQEYEQKLIQQMIQREISQAQQEMRNKALRQEAASENSGSSAGSSPPTATSVLQQNLSVAQAVKKNTKGTPDNPPTTNRLRRHSSSTPTIAVGDTIVDEDLQNKNGSKGPRLCTSVGDRDNKIGSKSKRATGKKNLNQNPNQAPRHKKQQQLQQANAGKKLPRAHSASPSAQMTSTDSNSGNSPPSSIPLSAGPSTESSPVVTPLRDDTSELSKALLNSKLKYALGTESGSSSSKLALRFSEDSPHVLGDTSGVNDVGTTLPIDIPVTSEEDLNRDTPHSDSSSSIDRKSPFIRDIMSQDGQLSIGSSIGVDTNLEHFNHLSKSRFLMLHKENGGIAPSQTAANGLGFSPFGMASHQTGSLLLQDLPGADTELPTSQPLTRGMPPPGLSGIPATNISGWPTSNPNLSDSIPIKSTNDWEAAFGFKSTEPKEPVVSSADDDLGFDPWVECSKGLADLMEKEKSQESGGGDHRMMSANADPFRSNMFYNNANAMHRRPTTLQDQNPRRHQMGFSGGSELINGFSNLLTHNSQILQQHKMPFQYEQQQQQHRQMEQNRFLQQQRLSSQFSRSDTSERSIQQLLEAANAQKQAFLNHGSPMAPSKELPGGKNSGNNIQEWQNGLRALLPSVNINFATQSQAQRPAARPMDSSLGLSSLGMPNNLQKVSLPHPPGITNQNMGHMPFLNKQNIMPPPGVGFGSRSSFLQNRQQWSGQESSMSTPGLSSNRLMSPTNIQSMFTGNRTESNPLPSAMPSYPPDPAIIQGGGMPGFQSQRRSRLFENPQSKSSSIINSNNNSNDEQPHWMKSLQALTEPDSPVHSMPPTNNPNLNQLFSQRPANAPSWPSMPGMFSNSGFGPSQPPPGFQVRPSLSKPTEFGMIQNLLENQS